LNADEETANRLSKNDQERTTSRQNGKSETQDHASTQPFITRRVLPYILQSNPHSVFGDFLNGKKLVCDSNPHLFFNRPLPTGRLIKQYVVCLKSKCTDFPMDELVMLHLVDVHQRVGSDLGCMFKLVSTGLVASVMR
jgi:hypothetical protein